MNNVITPHEKDSKRAAIVEIMHQSGALDRIELTPERYQALIGALRIAEQALLNEERHYASRPGSMSIYKERREQLLREREAVIDILCTFDI